MWPTSLLGSAVVAAGLSGCALYPTSPAGDGVEVNLKGYDPVAYFALGRPALGSPALRATHGGLTYQFANAHHRELFLTNPARYAPQYGGWCSQGVAYAVKLGSDPNWWRIVDGRLFIYGDREGHDFVGLALAERIAQADHYWASEVEHATPAWQVVKRLWFARVPHFRTGCELERAWLARNPGDPHDLFHGRCG